MAKRSMVETLGTLARTAEPSDHTPYETNRYIVTETALNTGSWAVLVASVKLLL
jgi:hypothetical protein